MRKRSNIPPRHGLKPTPRVAERLPCVANDLFKGLIAREKGPG